MKYLKINGQQGAFEVSRAVYGTGSALKGLEREKLFELLDLYVAAGGNTVDTAPGYCGGESEKTIGAWMRERGNREFIRVSTKACHAFPGEPGRLTEKDLIADMQLSLYQLDTDYIDLLWLHNDDPSVPVEKIMEAAQAAMETGSIRAIGCSNWTCERMEKANEYAVNHHLTPFFGHQVQMSLARPSEAYRTRYNVLSMDDEMYRWHLDHGMIVFAFSAMSQGYFSIAAERGLEALPENTAQYFDSPANRERLARVKEYMAKHRTTATVPVLGYVTGNCLPAAAIMSTTKPENLRDIMIAANAEITAEEADWLLNG